MIWHALVAKTLSDGYYGLENLALIPGYAGAAPIQNIGAYGSEVKNVLVNVETIDSNSGETRTLSNEECQFCYPSELGNAGSFFKNPVITRQQLDAIATQFSDVPAFSQADGRYKVPAAWLIERAGWKGYRDTGVGVHDRQALVLINHGHGSGQQIAQLADEIKSDIQNRFNVCLEREPVLY